MKQENNYDEIDNMLFDFFENAPDVPNSTKNTIKNAFNTPSRKKKNHPIYNLQRIAILVISFGFVTTSLVFAINFVSKLFTNSTDGIDTAVENGYVQNIDMEFVEDKNIGIKVNNLVMDDTNLDMTFEYYSIDDNITNLQIHEFIIRDESNNIIAYQLDKPNELLSLEKTFNFYCTRTEEIIIDENNHFNESILFTADKMPTSKTLIFEIKSFSTTNNSSISTILGNWIFTINLENKIMERINENYSTSYNKYVQNISTNLTETSLEINILLNTNLNEDILLELNSIVLKNNLNQEYNCIYKQFDNQENQSYIILKYDISKFYENINNLNLKIQLDINKNIDIYLSK